MSGPFESPAPSSLLDPSIFAYLENELEVERETRDSLATLVQRLDRAVATAQGLLSRVHATPRTHYGPLVKQVEAAFQDEVAAVAELSTLASQHPYYRYNTRWSRSVQNAIGTAVYCAWLGGFASIPEQVSASSTTHGAVHDAPRLGRLLTLEEVGALFRVPTNLKNRDAFHFTIEEYLLALTDLTQDLSRLAINVVAYGDFPLPLAINTFVKELFAGFQLLNLKNDILRRRADAVKYDVKRIEDVVYDLSLRDLVPRPKALPDDTEVS